MRGESLPIAVSLDDDLVGGVGEPVEGAVAQDRVAEEPEPLVDAAVGGCDSRPSPPRAMSPTARRYPQPGWPREKVWSSVRSASSPRPRAGGRRCVERCWPVTRHARRSDNSRRSCNMQTASTPARRAYQFPFAISLSASISSSLSATIRFSRAFSRSSSRAVWRRRPSSRRTGCASDGRSAPRSRPASPPRRSSTLRRAAAPPPAACARSAQARACVVSPRCPPLPTFAGQRTLINSGPVPGGWVTCATSLTPAVIDVP